MLIKVTGFGGIAPRVQPQALPNHMATQALNTKLWNGDLRPYFAPSLVLDEGGLPINLFKKANGRINSLFRFDVEPSDPDGAGFFFHSNEIASYARGPLRGDKSWLTLISGGGLAPRQTDNTMQAGPDYPTTWETLGIPVPDVSGVTSGVFGTPLDGVTEANDGVNRVYVIAWVNDRGQLGPTSEPIIVPSIWLPGQSVDLVDLPVVPGGGVVPQSKRIYRISETGSTFFFVDEIPFSQTTYTDNVDEAQLGEASPSVGYLEPPDDLTCIGVMSNGVAYGASGSDVCLSEPGLPHAWNPLARQPLKYDIVAMGHFGTNIVAATGENPYLIYGSQPGLMQERELNINQGCLSKRGLVSGEFGVTYPCKDGLVLINQRGNTIVTSGHFTRDEWRFLNPETMNAALYADRYLAFIDDLNGIGEPLGTDDSIFTALEPLSTQVNGGIIFDPREPERGLIMISEFGTAVYSDPVARALYYVNENGDLLQWDTDRSLPLQYLWQSKQFVYDTHVAFFFGRVLARKYDDCIVDFFSDGVLVHTQQVLNSDPFPMPMRVKGRLFHFRVRGNEVVTEVAFASSATEFTRA